VTAFQFVGGKGGVGKTTHAAMAALHAASRVRTLLVTTDPASSLSAVLDVPVGTAPAPVQGAPRLYAASVDAKTAFHRWLAQRRELLATIALRGTYLDDEDVARLLKLSLPGIDEIVGLLEVVRMAREPEPGYPSFDQVVVDTAPTGHTLRLLSAPALLGRVAALLDSLQSHHRTVVHALRGSYQGDAADALIAELERDGTSHSAMLRDRDATLITWVTIPEPMALEETSDAVRELEKAGIHIGRLIVNRMTPASADSCAWCRARRTFESRALAPLARRLGGREILAFPELPHEPRGVAALRAAAKHVRTWELPPPAAPLPQRIRARLADLPPEGGSHAEVQPAPVASGFSRKALDTVTGDARWILFGGKGGVGKSTCAAAAALHVARHKRVLLLSVDPAHSLGDVFAAKFDNQPRVVPGGPAALHVREIDAAAEMDRFRAKYIAAVDDAFGRIARSAGGDQAAFRDLIDLAPPGIDEVIAVADVADAVADRKGEYDVIITDTAPTGHALRLLQTPAVLRDWTLALMAILLKYREIVGAGTLAQLLVQLSKRLRGLQDILADRTQSRFVVVTRAAVLPLRESLDLIEALHPIGLSAGAIVVNAAGAGDCRRCRSSRIEQARVIAQLRASAAGGACAIIEAPAEIPPPHGVEALTEWGLAWRRLT
jgi:arsenite-transporting ATPase